MKETVVEIRKMDEQKRAYTYKTNNNNKNEKNKKRKKETRYQRKQAEV